MGEDLTKEIEKLESELVSIKIRLQRMEDFILSMPSPTDHIQLHEGYGVKPEEDHAFIDAVKIIRNYDHVSASLIQRRLSIGYARAATYIDTMEQKGMINGPSNAKPRTVYGDKVKEYLKKLEEKSE
jgi:DNA segregation ATPase FtsK/SpoIIIE-like protein